VWAGEMIFSSVRRDLLECSSREARDVGHGVVQITCSTSSDMLSGIIVNNNFSTS
jgi:hypothetical protein